MASIKTAGNQLYEQHDYVNACRKYKKSIRYYQYFLEKMTMKPVTEEDMADAKAMHDFHLLTQLNVAAVELKLENWVNAKCACDEVRIIN